MKTMRYARSAVPRRSYSASSQYADIDTESETRAHKPDYVLLLLSAALLSIGLVIVYSISPGIASYRNVSETYIINKQFLSIVMGIIGFVVAASLPLKFWKSMSKPLVVISFISATIVFLFGEEINGAQRWVTLSGISFQVAELFKLSLAIYLGIYLGTNKNRFSNSKGGLSSMLQDQTLKKLGIIILLIGIIVAGLESDLGSAAVMIAMIGGAAFLSGLSVKKLIPGVLVVLILVSLAVAISPYRRDRLKTFLNPTADCQKEGYQACQALITVGSGGIFGTGLSKGVQAYGYLPEAANDSIFAIISEKLGFFGASLIIAIYGIFFVRLKKIIDRAPDSFSSLYVSLIFIWLSTQAMINIGAMIGLLPLKGITLPFISYGGTSLLFIMIAIGIVFRISRHTKLSGRSRRDDIRKRDSTLNITRGQGY